jgi:hypothetical protein
VKLLILHTELHHVFKNIISMCNTCLEPGQ